MFDFDWNTGQVVLAALLLSGISLIVFLKTTGVVGDSLYFMTTHMKEVISITLIVIAFLLIIFCRDSLGHNLRAIYWHFTISQESDVITKISQCKTLIQNTRDGTPFVLEDDGNIGGLYRHKPEDYWNVCAKTFGQNYWQYDITIDGQPGGPLLCATFAATGQKSAKVNTWCSTVFARQDKPPKTPVSESSAGKT